MKEVFKDHRQKHPDFTEDDLKKVERLAGLGLSQKKIAHVFGMPYPTFEDRMKKYPELRMAYDIGVANATVKVAESAFEQAVSGKVPAMTMFWLKCKDNWKETQKHEHVTKVTIEDLVNGAAQLEEARDVTPDKDKDE